MHIAVSFVLPANTIKPAVKILIFRVSLVGNERLNLASEEIWEYEIKKYSLRK